jgi:large repetitive protein
MTSAIKHKSAFKKVVICLFLLAITLSEGWAQIGPPPVITAQPLDTNVVYAGTATFSVTAVGSALSYQWYKEGLLLFNTLLSGETRTNLVLTNAGDANAGKYFVTVNNASGTVTSRHAVLAVVTNSPPVAGNNGYSTPEDAPLVVPAPGVLANDSDVNGQALTAILLTNASHGNLSFNTNGSFIYTPNTNYNGSDSFVYRASDGFPTVFEQNNSGGSAMEIDDGETGAQSFRHGSAGGASYWINKVVVYLSRENKNHNGSLNFSVGTGVNSGAIAGSTVAIPQSGITDTTSGASFQTFAISYSSPLGPFTAGTTYYLNLDNQTGKKAYVEYYSNNSSYPNGTFYYNGSDQNEDMRFQIYQTILSNPATVTINVTPVNDPPVAVNDTTNTLEDTSVAIKVLANDTDPEGTPLTITATSTTNGTALVSGTNIVFTPSTNFNGSLVFHYTISDGSLYATGKVTVTVVAVNDSPVAGNDAYTTSENTLLTVPASGILTNDTDVENNPLSALLVTTVSHGALNLNTNGSFTYMPATNYFGNDSFTYQARDLSSNSAVAMVSLTVRDTQTPLSFVSEQMMAGGFSLHLSEPWGYECVVEVSTNMVDWIPIFTNAGLSGTVVFTDNTAARIPLRFYRAVAR